VAGTVRANGYLEQPAPITRTHRLCCFQSRWVVPGFSLVGVIASATKLLREEGGRRPETRNCWWRIYDLGLFYTIQFYLGIECIVFCGGVASFNVFCVLVTYPPGLGPLAVYIRCLGVALDREMYDRS
jgi:hypothetical protein